MTLKAADRLEILICYAVYFKKKSFLIEHLDDEPLNVIIFQDQSGSIKTFYLIIYKYLDTCNFKFIPLKYKKIFKNLIQNIRRATSSNLKIRKSPALTITQKSIHKKIEIIYRVSILSEQSLEQTKSTLFAIIKPRRTQLFSYQ